MREVFLIFYFLKNNLNLIYFFLIIIVFLFVYFFSLLKIVNENEKKEWNKKIIKYFNYKFECKNEVELTFDNVKDDIIEFLHNKNYLNEINKSSEIIKK